MTELEMSTTLGILFDPDCNKVLPDPEVCESIRKVSLAFAEVTMQKQLFGPVNEDVWLEFIPWHSLN